MELVLGWWKASSRKYVGGRLGEVGEVVEVVEYMAVVGDNWSWMELDGAGLKLDGAQQGVKKRDKEGQRGKKSQVTPARLATWRWVMPILCLE